MRCAIRCSSTRWFGVLHEGSAAELTSRFMRAAADQGLAVMLDLIVPHAAREATLLAEHPNWFRRGDQGLVAPVLANPDNARQPRVMADLAELELGNPDLHAAQIAYFADLACHYLDLGAAGFRCSSAYKVPPGLWRAIIARVRERHPDAVFLAAALGCPFDQVLALADCGFDLIFESSRWWDFHAPWFLEQRQQLRRIAPTVAFPEDHNTPRLAEAFDVHRPEEVARLYRARYLLAAGIASGVLMPMGFEFGVRRRLDPVATRPADWQADTATPAVDLTGFIAETNASEGPVRRV